MLTNEKLYQGQPSTTDTTLFTATKKVHKFHVNIVNTKEGPALLKISLPYSGQAVNPSNRIFNGYIDGLSTVHFLINQVMNIGDFLSATQDIPEALTLTITGVVEQ